jgi:hypothetical protein
MGKPFVLFEMKKKRMSRGAHKRLAMPMRDNVRQCEWLVEPSSISPEATLGVAVLQRAILDIITPGVKDKDRRNAIDWVVGVWGEEHERDYPMSFSRIVESFTPMEVSEFREKVLQFAQMAKEKQELADVFRFQRG